MYKNSHSQWSKCALSHLLNICFRILFWKLWEGFSWKKKNGMYIYFLHEFKFDNYFVSWQLSAKWCQDDTSRPHVTKMTLQKHSGLGYENFHIHHILLTSHPQASIFFQTSGHFFRQKIFRYKGERKTVFKGFLVSKHFNFYELNCHGQKIRRTPTDNIRN